MPRESNVRTMVIMYHKYCMALKGFVKHGGFLPERSPSVVSYCCAAELYYHIQPVARNGAAFWKKAAMFFCNLYNSFKLLKNGSTAKPRPPKTPSEAVFCL